MSSECVIIKASTIDYKWKHDFYHTPYFPILYFILHLEVNTSTVLYLLHILYMYLAMQLEESRKESHSLSGDNVEKMHRERTFSFLQHSKESTSVKHGL